MRIFKKEKGQIKELSSEIEELKEEVRKAKMSLPVEKVAYKEIERLAKTSPSSAEYTIGINYIDYLVSLPWNKMTDDNLDIKRAESILNEDHFGLTKIKDRILEHLAVRVLKMSCQHKVLVVDDGSPDGTGELADRMGEEDPRIHCLHRTKKEGLGKAYLAGFKWALTRDYDFIFEMDADFSHRPDYLPRFLSEVESADLVLGSRYIGGVNVINWPMSRLLLSYYANVYTRLVTGLPIRDATGGYKCFRREVLEAINLDDVKASGYSFQIEMTMRAWKKGFKIKEIPIIFVDRMKGKSKMSRKIVREAVTMVWKLRVKNIFGLLN